MIDRAELISLLREADNYISGQELCTKFGVSRNAVWKIINQLKQDGYDIEAVPNKGYVLKSTPDVLSKAEIMSRIETKWVGRNLFYYDETDSTNTRIRLFAESGEEAGTLAVADMQTAGRGRRGRTWISPSGSSVYMSLLLKPDILPTQASMLTLVMALAIASAIEDETGLDAQIKWPNDIVVDNNKVCGILTEMDMEADYIRDIIIGVGINVNQAELDEFAEEIRAHASSLRIKKGHIISRASLVAKSMFYFEKYYEQFIADGNLSGLRETYSNKLVNMNRGVKVLDPKGEYEGIAKGITDTGELIVEKADGTIAEVYAGEVSVRGLYGYT